MMLQKIKRIKIVKGFCIICATLLDRIGFGGGVKLYAPHFYYRYINKNNSFGKKIKMSDRNVDVVIPVTDKDLEILPYCIDGLRKQLLHQINNIFLVCRPNEKLQLFSNENNCKLVDECSVLPFTVKDISYNVNGLDRSGWLFQQFLKMSVDKISTSDFVYVIDADTVLVQKQKFDKDGKSIFLISDEYHLPYFEIYKKIFPNENVKRFSFVAHQMFIDTKKLTLLKNEIAAIHNCAWYDAILKKLDYSEISGFSEFETMGNWMSKKFPEQFDFEYWFNLSLTRNKLADFLNGKIDVSKYRSVSFQHYNN